jgi:hypothetical protein
MSGNKVTIFLQGGLGNQLFQYAFGLRLTNKHKLNVRYSTILLDLKLPGVTKRNFALHGLVEKYEIVSFLKSLALLILSQMNKKYLINDKNYRDINKVKYVIGYFQDYEVVEENWNEIEYKMGESQFYSELLNVNSSVEKYIGIHVRRGDYVSLDSANKYHGLLSNKYFIKSVKMCQKRDQLNKIKIVTDDESDIVDLICDLQKNYNEVKVYNGDLVSDLKILINSKVLILSNSSFSWWAAFISSKKAGTKIFAPNPWVVAEDYKRSKLLPENWEKIERDSIE